MPAEVRKADRVDAYTKKYWQKDSAKDNEVHKEERLADYAELVNGKFSLLRCKDSLTKPAL